MNKKFAIMTLSLCGAALLGGCGKKGATDYSKYVTLADYKNLSVERVVTTVTDEDVQDEIENELSLSAEYIEVTDRAAKDGDYVSVDYVGTIDGEEFEGGSAEGEELEIGSGWMLDDFESGIIGMEIGETKDVSVTFPEDYDETFGGKEAVFAITLNSISEIEMPEYNDDYVAEMSDYSTTAEYEAYLKESLQEAYDEDAQTMACENALQMIVDESTYNGYPQDLFDSTKESIEQENQAFAEALGLDDITDFLGEDFDIDEYTAYIVNEKMAVYTLASKEKIEVTDEEYEAALSDELLYSDYDSLEDLKKNINEETYKYELLYQKVLNFLGENCTFVDVDSDEYYADDEEFVDEDDEIAYEPDEGTDEESDEDLVEETDEEFAEETDEETSE